MDSFWRSSWDCADLTELEGSTLQLRPSRISNITDAKRASKQNESFEFFSLQLYVFFLIPSTMYVCMYVCRSLPNWLYSVWNCIQFTRNDIWCHFHEQIYHRSLLTDPNTSSITFRRSWCLFFIHFFPTKTQGNMNSCQRSHNEGSRHPVVRPNQHTAANISLVKYWTLIQRDENKSILPSMLDCLFKFVRKSDSIPADFFSYWWCIS